MKQNLFGEWRVESDEDDVAAKLEELGHSMADINADVEIWDEEEEGSRWCFRVIHNSTGEEILASLDIFETKEDAVTFIAPHVSAVVIREDFI